MRFWEAMVDTSVGGKVGEAVAKRLEESHKERSQEELYRAMSAMGQDHMVAIEELMKAVDALEKRVEELEGVVELTKASR